MEFFLVSAARRACLKVCTKRSASLLVAGWYGEDLMCLMALFIMSTLNSSAINWEPLSLTTCSDNPCVAKIFLHSSIVFLVVVEVIGTISARRACLKVCTKRSASLLVAGWYGEDLMCLMALFIISTSNSSALNWEPLSLTTCSGNPCVAKIFRHSLIGQ